jgi:CheY-like chemotaxis protein
MDAPKTQSDASTDTAPAAGRILILESDRLIRLLIVEWLHMAGNETVCAADLAAATAIRGPCDLVLADVPAPHRVARLTIARLMQTLPGTPVIAMSADITASGGAAREALARELGAAAVLVKPFTRNALLCAIHRARP